MTVCPLPIEGRRQIKVFIQKRLIWADWRLYLRKRLWIFLDAFAQIYHRLTVSRNRLSFFDLTDIETDLYFIIDDLWRNNWQDSTFRFDEASLPFTIKIFIVFFELSAYVTLLLIDLRSFWHFQLLFRFWTLFNEHIHLYLLCLKFCH